MLSELGQRIRSQREKRGLKQNDIASALQVSPQAVSKWERGENGPDITILGPLAKLLGVSIDWLLGNYGKESDVFEATVFVSSIHGAYQKSIDMPPRDIAAWANGTFSQITEAVLRGDGVPLKYMGDEFLCFFSGVNHRERAFKSLKLAKQIVAESPSLKVGMCSGEIYLGKMGHPDYARLDIMGETVNLAFLIMNWADEFSKTGIAASKSFCEILDKSHLAGKPKTVNFKSLDYGVPVQEIKI